MNFGFLFGHKKQVPNKPNKREHIELMIDDKIKEFEVRVMNNQDRINALTVEAREKLKLGDRNSAKRMLCKIKVLEFSLKIWNETINKLEEKKIKLDISNNFSDEDLNEFEQSYYSIIKNLNEEIKNATFPKEDGKEIDDDLSKLEGNKIDNNDMKFTKMESDNYMKDKIIELEKRIIVLENKIQKLEGKKSDFQSE